MALLEGAFPDTDHVIPVSPPFTFRADREPLQSAVHRAIRCAKEDQSPNLLILEFFSDRLTITSNTPGIGSAAEHLTGEWRGPEGFQVGMNGVYLLRCLEVYEGQGVILGGSSTVGAWSVSSGSLEEDRIAALSPVRLRSAFQEGGDNHGED
jgi:DNA polymerase III sliding clamp (beta) subunit (PCNA family)